MDRKEAQQRIDELVAHMAKAKIKGDDDFVAFCDEADALREAVGGVGGLEARLAALDEAQRKLSEQLSFCNLPL